MLEEIREWILSQYKYQVEINKNDFTDSLVVDFEDDNKIARFTLWDDKSCILEIVQIDTGAYVINERRELFDIDGIKETFKEFNALLI